MSAFTVTMLQAITIGIGFAIGYYFLNKASLKLWRVFVGFLVGFAVSWFAGVMLWALTAALMSSDIPNAVMAGITKSFLFAIVGGGMGVYFGGRKAKLQDKPTLNPAVHADAAR